MSELTDRLTAAYRDRLGAATAGLLARILAAWLVLYDPARPLWSLARLGELTAVLTEGAQRFAAEEAARYLAALTAATTGRPLEQVGRYSIPPGLIGISAAGGPLAGLTGLAPAIWWARFTSGAPRTLAYAAALGWLGRVAASEPYRAANQVVIYNARTDSRMTGRARRSTRPGSCDWCLMLAERGYTVVAVTFAAHAHCRCTAAPEIR